MKRAKGGTAAIRVLEARNVPHRIHSYDFAPTELGIGEQAAKALGIDAARLFKTLMVRLDETSLAIALVPSDRSMQPKALAAALGAKRAAMADLKAAERASGYVKGGISPLGQRKALPCIVDRSALDHKTVVVNGGRRGLQVELAPEDLIGILDAKIADLSN